MGFWRDVMGFFWGTESFPLLVMVLGWPSTIALGVRAWRRRTDRTFTPSPRPR